VWPEEKREGGKQLREKKRNGTEMEKGIILPAGSEDRQERTNF